MTQNDLAELRRLHEAATKGVFWQEEVAFSESCKVHLPALLDELEAAREENERLTDVIFQGEGIDATGELGITRQNFREWLRERDEEVRKLKADYQRLEKIRRDLMERCERMRSMEGLPLDEIAARQIARDRRQKLIGAAEELERIAQDREVGGMCRRLRVLLCDYEQTEAPRDMTITRAFIEATELLERAAKLRQEAEDATR